MNGIKVEGDKQKIGEALDALSGLLPCKPSLGNVSIIRDRHGDYVGTRNASALMDLVYALQNAARPKPMEALAQSVAGIGG